jgi:hypothetical protein
LGREGNEALDFFALVEIFVDGVLATSIIKIKDRLGELNETGLGGITLAEPVDVEKSLLSNNESSLHLLLLILVKIWHIGKRNFLDSSHELFAFVIIRRVGEEGGGRKDHSLDELHEALVLKAVARDDVLIRLVLLLVSLVDFPVDISIDSLSINEDV